MPERQADRPARLPSIRQRLARVVLKATLAWSVGAAALVGWAAHRQIEVVMDGTLRESAEILYGMLSFNVAGLPLGSGGAMPAPAHHERLVWQVVDADGHVLLRSHRVDGQPLPMLAGPGLSDTPGGGRVFAIDFGQAGPGARLLVAQPATERRDATVSATLFTAGAALAVGLVCAGWLRHRVRSELLPLRELSEAVAAFHPTEAGAALAVPAREELLPIRDAILHLAERLAVRVDSERAFTAHAAHALRTPLAGLAAQLAVAMREAPDGLKPRILKARQASLRLQRVVNALLTLFRSSVEPHLQPLDLPGLVHSLAIEGLEVRVTEDGEPLRMDQDLLAAAMLNLLDNASRYGARHVEVHTQRRGVEGVLRVSDDGEGVTAERLSQLQAALRAQRYDDAMGLGLMLADLVARAHHGGLSLPAVDRGFTVELVLPQAGASPA
jgi:two-component system OmpR family sensor kinase